MKIFKKLVLFLVLICFFTQPLQASQPFVFPDVRLDRGCEFNLQGSAEKKWLWFDALQVALYLESDSSDPENVLDDEKSKRIEVQYFVPISREKITRFTVDKMKENLNEQEFQMVQSFLDEMSQLFVDLKRNDRFTLSYVPTQGVKFIHNDNERGIINDPDFARAIFSTWLGHDPVDQRVKREILGLEEKS